MSRPHRTSPNVPRGSSFGLESPSLAPTVLDYAEIARSGSRAQRRYAEKLIKRQVQRQKRGRR